MSDEALASMIEQARRLSRAGDHRAAIASLNQAVLGYAALASQQPWFRRKLGLVQLLRSRQHELTGNLGAAIVDMRAARNSFRRVFEEDDARFQVEYVYTRREARRMVLRLILPVLLLAMGVIVGLTIRDLVTAAPAARGDVVVRLCVTGGVGLILLIAYLRLNSDSGRSPL